MRDRAVRRVRTFVRAVLLVSGVLRAASGYAQPAPPPRLVYEVPADVPACGNELGLRQQIALVVGRDIFAPAEGDDLPGLTQVVAARVTVHRDGATLGLEIALVDRGGGVRAHRRLGPFPLDCAELRESAVVVLTAALLPVRAVTSPLPATSPASTTIQIVSTPTAAPPPAVAPARPRPPAEGIHGGFLATAHLAVARSPAPAGGFGAGLWVGTSHLVAALEVAVDLPTDGDAPGVGGFTLQQVLGTASGCLRAGWFAGCAIVQPGVAWAVGRNVARPESGATPVLDVGLRGVIELPLGRVLALRASLDGTVTVLGFEAAFQWSDASPERTAVWRTAPVTAAVTFGPVVRLW